MTEDLVLKTIKAEINILVAENYKLVAREILSQNKTKYSPSTASAAGGIEMKRLALLP